MNLDHHLSRRRRGWRALGSLAAVLAIAAIAASAVLARTSAAPANTSPPTISGSPREGNTLTADNGTWTNGPTAFAYQWQQCNASGSGCSDIAGATATATAKTYSLKAADVDHTVRVTVTASNADGQSSANSTATAVVSSSKGPVNTAPPAISGTAKVGEELTASNGTWTGGVDSYGYQWQRCDSSGASCTAVTDATSRTYGVRTVDAGHTLRVVVTAKNASDSTSATSAPTPVVTGTGGGTTTVTSTVSGNKAPTISFVSLKRIGVRVYARFRTCDDSAKAITVIERDTKPRVAAYTRRFSIPGQPCATRSRNWILPARFRHGRYTATLRAVDKSGRTSRTVSRSLTFR
jgi:hypothetical protein